MYKGSQETATIITPRLLDEIVFHFRELIRFNTTNPPGNESPAACYIADVLNRNGIENELIEPVPGRASVVARLRGDGSARPLLLMSHLDVVGAEEENWDHHPFSAHEEDGYIWGRGALDCKNTVALWMTALLALSRSETPLKRDVIFLAAADEEGGGRYGTGWIVKHRPEFINAEAALNEGGGIALGLMGRTYYTYQTGEKGNLWLRITVRGTAGHGSVPRHDNPVGRIIRLLLGIQRKAGGAAPTRTMREMIKTFSSHSRFPGNVLIRLVLNPLLSEFLIRRGLGESEMAPVIRALVRNTITPTVLRAGHKSNVIPSEAVAELDIRVLPGTDIHRYLENIKRALGEDVEVEVLDIQPPSESPVDHPLADSIKRVLSRHHPGAPVIPILLPAVSDGGYLRRLGTVVYGFSPLLPGEDTDRIHGHNERISIDSLLYSLKIGLEVIMDYSSSDTFNKKFIKS